MESTYLLSYFPSHTGLILESHSMYVCLGHKSEETEEAFTNSVSWARDSHRERGLSGLAAGCGRRKCLFHKKGLMKGEPQEEVMGCEEKADQRGGNLGSISVSRQVQGCGGTQAECQQQQQETATLACATHVRRPRRQSSGCWGLNPGPLGERREIQTCNHQAISPAPGIFSTAYIWNELGPFLASVVSAGGTCPHCTASFIVLSS